MDSAGTLTTDDVCLAVREAGFALGPEDISLDPRDERLAVALPGGYMAWFPTNADGSARLKIERKVLHLLADRCRFAAPKIVYVSPSGFDVRATVSRRTQALGFVSADPARSRIGASDRRFPRRNSGGAAHTDFRSRRCRLVATSGLLAKLMRLDSRPPSRRGRGSGTAAPR